MERALADKRAPAVTPAALTGAIRIVLLIATCAVAADLPGNAVDITGLDLPQIGSAIPPFAPIWAPFLLVVIWFNALCDGNGRFVLRLDRSMPWFLTLLAVIGTIEFGQAYYGGRIPNAEMLLRLGWICFVFVALGSFASLENVFDWLIAGLLGVTAISAILMLTFPEDSLSRLGLFDFFKSEFRPSVSVVNSSAYEFALAALLGMGALLLGRSPVLPSWLIFGLTLISALGVLGTKSRGAWLVLVLGVLSLCCVRACQVFRINSKRRLTLVAAAGVAVVVVAVLLSAHWGLASVRLDRFFSLGRGFSHELDARQAEGSLDPTSTNVRIAMVRTSLELFRESPWIGHGLAATREVRTMGNATHGIPLELIAAYGIAGLIPALGLVWSLATAGRAREAPHAFYVVLASLAVATLALQSPPQWFAVALGIVAIPRVERMGKLK